MRSQQWGVAAPQDDGGLSNWSGSQRFRPSRIAIPRDESELAAIVGTVASRGGTLRPVGSMHSSSPLYVTDDTLVSLDAFTGIKAHDPSAHTAVVGAGMVLRELGDALAELGLAMPNYGDVATQTIAGALGTGTHGSGRSLQNLAATLVGGTLVTADGEARIFTAETHPELTSALRVSMGALGVLATVNLQLQPTFMLTRREWCARHDDLLPRLNGLAEHNRNFDFYWYPRSDLIKFRCLTPPEETTDYGSFAHLVEDRTGPSHEVIPKHSDLPHRFEEMEYALPAAAGPDCFAEIRRRMLARWRSIVGWRVLYRLVKSDDGWLSPAHGRDTVTISLHQNATLPYRDFFADLEPVFRAHGGRPHWGKIHSLKAAELALLYPKWADFQSLRGSLDPAGLFMSEALSRLLDPEHAHS